MVDDSDAKGRASAAPAGWYPDPAGSDEERRWTGEEWSHDLRGKPGSVPDASSALVIGQQLRKSQASKFISRLESCLYEGEVLEALYWAIGVRTMVNALAITNARVLALRSDRSSLIALDACGSEISGVAIVRGRLGNPRLAVTVSGAEPLIFGSVRREDADELVRRIDRLSRTEPPMAVRDAIQQQTMELAARAGDGPEQLPGSPTSSTEVATTKQEEIIKLREVLMHLMTRARREHVSYDARVGSLIGMTSARDPTHVIELGKVSTAGVTQGTVGLEEIRKHWQTREAAEERGADEPERVKANRERQTEAADFRTVGKVSKKGLEEIHKHCRPGEVPLFVIGSGTAGALAAFEDRCLIVKKGAMTGFMTGALGGGRVTTFMYGQITGIEYNSGFVSGVLEILTPSYQGTANKDYWRGTTRGRNADSNDPFTLSNTLPLAKHEHERARPLIDELRKRVANAHQPVVRIEGQQVSNGTASGLAAELEKLAALHANGLLDQDEFKAAKAALIARTPAQ